MAQNTAVKIRTSPTESVNLPHSRPSHCSAGSTAPYHRAVMAAPAGAQGEIRGKEHRQRNTPAAQGAAAHRGSALPVKHMTQWARTMTLPVSSVISAEQKASLPPRRSTLPTVVRVLPAAAADR